MHVSGVDDLLRRRDRSAAVEGMLLGLHAVLYLTTVLWVLSPPSGRGFRGRPAGPLRPLPGVHLAPNHKGMPVLVDDSDLGFVRRQIITSRNVTGGPLIAFLFGGLNYQIEHHLFPAMPRPNLPRARADHPDVLRRSRHRLSRVQRLRFLPAGAHLPQHGRWALEAATMSANAWATTRSASSTGPPRHRTGQARVVAGTTASATSANTGSKPASKGRRRHYSGPEPPRAGRPHHLGRPLRRPRRFAGAALEPCIALRRRLQ